MAIEDQMQQQQLHPVDTSDPMKPKSLLPISFSNGALKKHQQQHQDLYRECLKNHAASLGGHALDGCGEFMLSPNSNPSVPTSLTCAACGCHRNFHRRVSRFGDEDDGGGGGVEDEDREPEAHYYYSAPHMLMALSSGGRGGPMPPGPNKSAGLPRKRFRTRFSKEQKEKMHELSERLGWRLQKRDDALVEECCREIGVGRGVFKVWMHNNKHNFLSSSSSKRGGGGAALPTNGGAGGGEEMNANNGHGGGNGKADLDANYHSSPSPAPSSSR